MFFFSQAALKSLVFLLIVNCAAQHKLSCTATVRSLNLASFQCHSFSWILNYCSFSVLLWHHGYQLLFLRVRHKKQRKAPLSGICQSSSSRATAVEFHTGIWVWSTLPVDCSHWGCQPTWLLSVDGNERENVCFVDLAKMIIGVCVCVVWLVSSQPHSPCSTDRGALVAQNKHQTSNSI